MKNMMCIFCLYYTLSIKKSISIFFLLNAKFTLRPIYTLNLIYIPQALYLLFLKCSCIPT